MRIAISTEGKNVSGHFGYCDGFTIYDIENKEISGKEFTLNPGYKPGFLPVFLNDLGVNVIISGGMGVNAKDLFEKNDIKVIVGAEGDCDEVVKMYINGNLKSDESVCEGYEHKRQCGE